MQAKRWGFAAMLKKGKENVAPKQPQDDSAQTKPAADVALSAANVLHEQQNHGSHRTAFPPYEPCSDTFVKSTDQNPSPDQEDKRKCTSSQEPNTEDQRGRSAREIDQTSDPAAVDCQLVLPTQAARQQQVQHKSNSLALMKSQLLKSLEPQSAAFTPGEPPVA